jgi:uncharacterized membrane protein
MQGRFCAKCGAAAPGAAPQAPSPQPGTSLSLPGLNENVASALCYLALVLTGVLFLFLEPYNRNKTIRFHAFQSIFVWIGITVVSLGIRIVFGTLLDGPHTYWLMDLIWTAYGLGTLALWLALMYRAYMGERWVAPVVGEMAQKLA